MKSFKTWNKKEISFAFSFILFLISFTTANAKAKADCAAAVLSLIPFSSVTGGLKSEVQELRGAVSQLNHTSREAVRQLSSKADDLRSMRE